MGKCLSGFVDDGSVESRRLRQLTLMCHRHPHEYVDASKPRAHYAFCYGFTKEIGGNCSRRVHTEWVIF